MLAPEVGRFIDGNPNGGTVVTAAFMNALLGELQGILALEDVELQTSGTLPADHKQLAAVLASAWVRIREGGVYPETADDNSILIDAAALVAGEWPFRIWRNGAWETPDEPWLTADSGGSDSGTPEPVEGITEFDDTVHGQRGGGELHALATETKPGFLSPAGYSLLLTLSEDYPKRLVGNWMSVQASNTYLINHGLKGLPEVVQVWFRASENGPRQRVDNFFSPQQRFCGCSIADSTNETITLITGDRVWAGYTTDGFQEFSSGEYSVQVLTHG